jgi:protoheme IX farnesyltransferase
MSSSQEEVVGTAIAPPSADVNRASILISILSRGRAFYELAKPNLSGLVVITGIFGFYLASSGLASIDGFRFLHLVAGMALTAAGACAANMYIERALDAIMVRTRHRPIPSGRVSPREALGFSVAAFALGFTELWIFCGAIPALLSLLTLAVYAFVYTPLKKRGPIAIAIGAIPGAIPPVMGWAAVRGEIGVGGLALFAVLFLWQFPHFLALAFMYRDDYARAGFRFLPARHPGAAFAFGAALTVFASVGPFALGFAGWIYLAGALAIGAFFFAVCLRAARKLTAARARSAFFASITYLPALLALMLLDRVLGA